jgi:DNA polymerase elongation subunit (family B)
MQNEFYTNLSRYGNSILYRGYKDGKRIQYKVPFAPTLFVPVEKPTEFKTLDGKYVEPVKLENMREAKEFMERYQDVANFEIYGNTNYLAQFVSEHWPVEINFDRNLINVTNIDIEVESDEGFPEPEEAKFPITAIAIKNNIDNTFYVWGCGDYDVSKSIMTENRVVYVKCHDERELLVRFMAHWNSPVNMPDVVTGWNIRNFDIPYIVNRTLRICDEDLVKKLSPWGRVEEKQITMMKKVTQVYEIIGIPQVDYMDLFKKFGHSFGPQESYSLNHIASVVLGETKLAYDGTLSSLYHTDHQKFIDYNIRDVDLVDRMEDKIGLITLCFTMAYKAGVNYNDTFGTTGIWDTLIYRFLKKQNIVVPPNKDSFKSDYAGGYVKDPQCGVHDWVASFDVNSLYPNIIVQWNMSPETIMKGRYDHRVTPDSILEGYIPEKVEGVGICGSGQMFSNAKQGFMPQIIEQLYDERVFIKKQMIASKKELEVADKTNKQEIYRIERDIARYENQQTSIKLLLNSLYGALGNKYFRYFTMEIAEGITLSGQMIIRWAEKHVNDYLNKALRNKDYKDYVIAIDTDSVYVALEQIVKSTGLTDKVKITNLLDKLCSDSLESVLDKCFNNLSTSMNVHKKRITMKREAIADRAIWVAKKRYILNVLDNEGVRYAKPKLKIMGIEAIKSSTPGTCREAFEELFQVLISGTESETQAFISKYRETFEALPPEAKAFPRGVSGIKKYMDKQTLYVKGTPINSRAAILYNNLLKQHSLKTYPQIREGDKIKYIHLYPNNPMKENVIAFIDVLPPEFKLDRYIDNDTQFEKAFLDPAKSIIEAIGWKAEPTASLEDFFQ